MIFNLRNKACFVASSSVGYHSFGEMLEVIQMFLAFSTVADPLMSTITG